MKPLKLETPRKVSLVELVEVVSTRGDGKEDPIRLVVQYWSKDGRLMAEKDTLKDDKND